MRLAIEFTGGGYLPICRLDPLPPVDPLVFVAEPTWWYWLVTQTRAGSPRRFYELRLRRPRPTAPDRSPRRGASQPPAPQARCAQGDNPTAETHMFVESSERMVQYFASA